jgi:hypothetical protein
MEVKCRIALYIVQLMASVLERLEVYDLSVVLGRGPTQVGTTPNMMLRAMIRSDGESEIKITL